MWLPQRVIAACAGVVCAAIGLTAAPAAAAPSLLTTPCGPSYNNPLTAVPWPLHRLDPSAAWPLSRGKGIIVAVIDSGVSTTHVKLAGQVLPGTDFVEQGGDGTCDNDGHGTVVGGIIAASDTLGNGNGAPFYGVAPDAKILPVRALPDSQKTSDPTLPGRIATAIRWAADNGARVINLSLTTPATTELADAVKYAQSKDIVLVAASGNDGGTASGDKPVYPAAYDGVVAVGGIDKDGKHVNTSNTANYIAVSAPGLYIEGPAPRGDGYVVEAGGGTSFAAAYVSGVAALVRGYYPTMNADQVIRRILLTADPPPNGRDSQVGYGVVNPYRAVAAIIDSQDSAAAPPIGAMPPPVPVADPLALPKRVAIWVAVAGAVIAVSLLLLAGLVRRRRRETGSMREPAPAGVRMRDDFVPLIGQTLSISAPSVQRAGAMPTTLPTGAASMRRQ